MDSSNLYFHQKSILGLLAEEEDSISCSSEEEEEVNSSNGPLQDMSSLLQQLPSKRGLSKHYQGKSQSFTSLSKVMSLEDMAKPEKLQGCRRSYAGGLSQINHSRRSSSIANNASRGCCGPPMAPHRSTTTTSISNQTALFA